MTTAAETPRRRAAYPTAKIRRTFRVNLAHYNTAGDACERAGTSLAREIDAVLERLANGDRPTTAPPPVKGRKR